MAKCYKLYKSSDLIPDEDLCNDFILLSYSDVELVHCYKDCEVLVNFLSECSLRVVYQSKGIVRIDQEHFEILYKELALFLKRVLIGNYERKVLDEFEGMLGNMLESKEYLSKNFYLEYTVVIDFRKKKKVI